THCRRDHATKEITADVCFWGYTKTFQNPPGWVGESWGGQLSPPLSHVCTCGTWSTQHDRSSKGNDDPADPVPPNSSARKQSTQPTPNVCESQRWNRCAAGESTHTVPPLTKKHKLAFAAYINSSTDC
ncbi:unnamed protein product, partial [Ectocarpus fasciculatus]